MIIIPEYLSRPPDIISECGEEIWTGVGSNMYLVRLQPRAKTELRALFRTKEWCFILAGQPILYMDPKGMLLHKGLTITVLPGQAYQLVNRFKEDALFLIETNITVSEQDFLVH